MNNSIPLVFDIMSSPLVTLTAVQSLEEAERVFSTSNLSSAPVLGVRDRVLGVLTDFQLLKCFISRSTGNKDKVYLGNFASEMDPAVTIEWNEPINNAFRLMIQSPNHRIFVTKNGQLVGTLSPKNILPYMTNSKEDDARKATGPSENQKEILNVVADLENTKAEITEYQKFFMNAPYMMHSMNLSGEIVLANKMLHYVLGYDENELVGKTILDLYPTQNHKEAQNGLQLLRQVGVFPMLNVLMVKKDRELVKVDISTMLKKDADGLAIGTITVGRLSDSSAMLDALKRVLHIFNKNSETTES